MRIILLMICFLFISCSPALYPSGPAQIFYSSKEFSTPTKLSKEIKNISRNLFSFSKYLTVKYADGTKEKILKTDIWGYRDAHNNVYRYYEYDNYAYEVYTVDVIVVYKLTGRWTRTFFSKTLDSEIYKYSRRNLKKYLDEATYQKVLKNKRLSRML